MASTFVCAAEKTRAPSAFAHDVYVLAEREGLSDEALAVIARRADRAKLRPEWLGESALSDDLLDFMARDKRSPFEALQRPSSARWQTGYLQGLAGEFLFQQRMHRLLPGYELAGRQVRLGATEVDFVVAPRHRPRELRPVEVKAWSRSRWQRALAADEKVMRREPLLEAETRAFGELQHVLDQLCDAARATGRSPLLVTLDSLTPAQERRLVALFARDWPGALPPPQRLALPTCDVRALRDEIALDLAHRQDSAGR